MWWTFATAAIASLTALLIAFVAYPWQRSLDRRAKFDLEQREALRKFLVDWYSIVEDTMNLTNFELNSDDPTALGREFVVLRSKGESLSFTYLLSCPEEDLANVA